jgi:cupin 2 domain-containing protein
VGSKGNLFEGFPAVLVNEFTERLAGNHGVRVERIVSHGHASPPGFWYDQSETEFVVLVRGHARLQFEGGAAVELKPGDHLTIPPHTRHRVLWTTGEEETVWLAVFF